ncbi:MAG TPA: hypothetical protein DIU15_01155, partial [Deltaproteobacteria bacterium]|nr:hypothetical protein [Deltaproteobacteria bacterium]
DNDCSGEADDGCEPDPNDFELPEDVDLGGCSCSAGDPYSLTDPGARAHALLILALVALIPRGRRRRSRVVT